MGSITYIDKSVLIVQERIDLHKEYIAQLPSSKTSGMKRLMAETTIKELELVIQLIIEKG